MAFVAEVRLSHPDLPLVPTITAGTDATIRHEYEVVGEDVLLFVSVFGEDYAELEAAFVSDHTVSEPTRVATFSNRAVYRVRKETDLDLIPQHCTEHGLFVFKMTSGDEGWILRLHLPEREVLREFRAYCRAHDISFHVNQLYESAPTDAADASVLTTSQEELLLMAYYAGYYDIPRRVSQTDLADQLDVSTSAVSQRLRRAVAKLIATTIEESHTNLDRG